MKLANELSKPVAMMAYPSFYIFMAIVSRLGHHVVWHKEEEDEAEQGGGKGLLMFWLMLLVITACSTFMDTELEINLPCNLIVWL